MELKQYVTLQRNLKRNISSRKRQFSTVEKRTSKKSTTGKTFLVWGLVLVFTVPIFRSGLKTDLTFYEFIKNHTIFGDPVEYLPKEDYEMELNN